VTIVKDWDPNDQTEEMLNNHYYKSEKKEPHETPEECKACFADSCSKLLKNFKSFGTDQLKKVTLFFFKDNDGNVWAHICNGRHRVCTVETLIRANCRVMLDNSWPSSYEDLKEQKYRFSVLCDSSGDPLGITPFSAASWVVTDCELEASIVPRSQADLERTAVLHSVQQFYTQLMIATATEVKKMEAKKPRGSGKKKKKDEELTLQTATQFLDSATNWSLSSRGICGDDVDIYLFQPEDKARFDLDQLPSDPGVMKTRRNYTLVPNLEYSLTGMETVLRLAVQVMAFDRDEHVKSGEGGRLLVPLHLAMGFLSEVLVGARLPNASLAAAGKVRFLTLLPLQLHWKREDLVLYVSRWAAGPKSSVSGGRFVNSMMNNVLCAHFHHTDKGAFGLLKNMIGDEAWSSDDPIWLFAGASASKPREKSVWEAFYYANTCFDFCRLHRPEERPGIVREWMKIAVADLRTDEIGTNKMLAASPHLKKTYDLLCAAEEKKKAEEAKAAAKDAEQAAVAAEAAGGASEKSVRVESSKRMQLEEGSRTVTEIVADLKTVRGGKKFDGKKFDGFLAELNAISAKAAATEAELARLKNAQDKDKAAEEEKKKKTAELKKQETADQAKAKQKGAPVFALPENPGNMIVSFDLQQTLSRYFQGVGLSAVVWSPMHPQDDDEVLALSDILALHNLKRPLIVAVLAISNKATALHQSVGFFETCWEQVTLTLVGNTRKTVVFGKLFSCGTSLGDSNVCVAFRQYAIEGQLLEEDMDLLNLPQAAAVQSSFDTLHTKDKESALMSPRIHCCQVVTSALLPLSLSNSSVICGVLALVVPSQTFSSRSQVYPGAFLLDDSPTQGRTVVFGNRDSPRFFPPAWNPQAALEQGVEEELNDSASLAEEIEDGAVVVTPKTSSGKKKPAEVKKRGRTSPAPKKVASKNTTPKKKKVVSGDEMDEHDDDEEDDEDDEEEHMSEDEEDDE